MSVKLFERQGTNRLLLATLLVREAEVFVSKEVGLDRNGLAISITEDGVKAAKFSRLRDKILRARKKGEQIELPINSGWEFNGYRLEGLCVLDFMYRGEPVITLRFDGNPQTCSERELALLHAFLVGQLRNEALENLVDSQNTEKLFESRKAEEFVGNLTKLSVQLFGLSHVLRLRGDKHRVEPIATKFWGGTPFADYIHSSGNFRLVKRHVEKVSYGQFSIVRHQRSMDRLS